MNFNPLFPGMVCAKFGWNWTRGSEDEDENVKSLRQRRHQGNNDDEQRTHFYQRSSAEPSALVSSKQYGYCVEIFEFWGKIIFIFGPYRVLICLERYVNGMCNMSIFIFTLQSWEILTIVKKVPREIKLNENTKTAIFQREGDISYIRLVIFYHRHTTTHPENFMFIS